MGYPSNFRLTLGALKLMTTEQLKAEAARYCLSVPELGDRDSIIDAIMLHLENTSINVLSQAEETTNQDQLLTASTNNTLEQILSPLIPLVSSIAKQMQEQQQLLQQILQAVTAGTTGVALSQNDANTLSAVSDICSEIEQKFSRQSLIETTLAVNVLSPQIPEFGGTDVENVKLWIQRIDQVSKIHKVPDDIIFLAATSKLVKLARCWFDFGSGPMIESWTGFKEVIMKRFNRRGLFLVILSKMKDRKWNHLEESFQEYVMDCLSLIHNIDLTPKEAIDLLIDGIEIESVQNAARIASLHIDSIDEFLNKMDEITSDSWYSNPPKSTKSTEQQSNNCEKADHLLKDCQIFCSYCKTPGHCQLDCYKLKEEDTQHSHSTPSPAVLKVQTLPDSYMTKNINEFYSKTSCLKIIKLNGYKCCLYALVATGSLFSFIRVDIYKKFFKSFKKSLRSSNISYEDTLVFYQFKVYGSRKTTLCCDQIPMVNFDVNLHVLKEDYDTTTEIILGTDFLDKNDVTIAFDN